MTALTLPNAFRNAVNQGVAKQAFEDLRDFVAQGLGGAAESTLTIATGVVTPTSGLHAIDTEAAAATDDLDTIAQTNLQDGQLLTIRIANAARLVRVRHNIGGTGKILLQGGSNFTLANTSAFLMLKRVGTSWEEIARFVGPLRERLLASRTYYVRTDGNDNNDGLTNTAAGAFLTIQKCWNIVRDTLDLNGFTVTCQIADGTYNAGLNANGPLVGQEQAARFIVLGNAASPQNVVISTTGSNAISVQSGAKLRLSGVEL
uniref:hypothetical protein n=1 Tax=Dongia deserti TaxID=2268030 RepID=UPI0025470740